MKYIVKLGEIKYSWDLDANERYIQKVVSYERKMIKYCYLKYTPEKVHHYKIEKAALKAAQAFNGTVEVV